MPRTDHFAERIGAVSLPEAVLLDVGQDPADTVVPVPDTPSGPFPEPVLEPQPLPTIEPVPVPRLCVTNLRSGCYALSFTPDNTPVFGTRFRGTMRVDRVGTRVRFSADLYRWRFLDDIVVRPGEIMPADIERAARALQDGTAADDGDAIPIHRRRRYHSYLKGTTARLVTRRPVSGPCTFTLVFDEFVYNHPATGFSGTFNAAPTRALRFVMRSSGQPDGYTGDVFDGATHVGTASLRWISERFRRATLRLHTLQGAVAPPADVAGSTFATIFADAGYELSFVDGGTIALPQALQGTNINTCWSEANLHTLMQAVPGYDPTVLDREWRIELVAVPATLGCSRGIMFDSSLGADPNTIPREGTATFSHDGYPAADFGGGLSHYDAATGGQQRNFTRAYLRSATHEVGHAFNQIHQGFEGGNDNSIMTPTPSVAQVIGTGGTFPDDINLAFNETVKGHLRHLPDPAVRPGGMDFFGAAVSAPQAADVLWPDDAELTVQVSKPRVALGEVLRVAFALENRGESSLTAPERLDLESLTVRINVTDPVGRITFMRPARVASCPRLGLQQLPGGEAVQGEADVFWGRDGFAFETAGRHELEVIALWYVGGIPVAASGTQTVFVSHPTTDTDNEVAAALLQPDVGRAVATGDAETVRAAVSRLGGGAAATRTADVPGEAASHPALDALRERGLLDGGGPAPARAPSGRGS